MDEQDNRNRSTRGYQAENPGGRDPYGSPHQPQQWSDTGGRQAGGDWQDERARNRAPGGWSEAGPYGQQGGYRETGYRDNRDDRRWSNDDGAARTRYNAYGPSSFEHGYAEVGHGSGRNAGFGPSNLDAGYEDDYRYGGPRYAERDLGYAGGAMPTGYGSDRGRGYRRGSDHDRDRGFFEKAGDEIASWFGDEDAARRREIDHRGRGPTGYKRSDDRIREDVCDRLTDDWAVDARNITVSVNKGEVTLDGSVDSRQAKRRAEDCIDRISGVGHVQNNLRVQDRSSTSATAGNSGRADNA